MSYTCPPQQRISEGTTFDIFRMRSESAVCTLWFPHAPNINVVDEWSKRLRTFGGEVPAATGCNKASRNIDIGGTGVRGHRRLKASHSKRLRTFVGQQ